jgi:hypothetical protein
LWQNEQRSVSSGVLGFTSNSLFLADLILRPVGPAK